ncbi:MAG: acyltransferase [Verrucomicrobia bacterium]|nr:acyltransferase [Verrucomicrobiota bacterium]MCF7708268.1 acyltransferase [Verrucomicrobiota bacterium]
MSEDTLRRNLKYAGKGLKVFKGSRLFPPEVISVGESTRIDEGVFIYGGAGVDIGCNVHIAAGAAIIGGGECRIGDFAGISARALIITGLEDINSGKPTNPTVPPECRVVKRGKVSVGAHAVVFAGAIVLPNVEIGEGAVVAAGAIVHHDLKPWRVYAGNPLVQVGARREGDIKKIAAMIR